MDRPPNQEGSVYLGPPIDPNGFIQKQALPLGKARSLGELADEFVFFTLAPAYLYGRFFDGILADFMFEQGRETPVYFHRFRNPIFRGLEAVNGDPGWNFGLLAVRKEDWDALSGFIISIVISDSDQKTFVAFGEQPLTIMDPLAFDFTQVWRKDLPSIGIVAFGVNSNVRLIAFSQGISMLMDPPTLLGFPPDPEILKAADAYFGGKNPVMAREAHRASVAKEKLNEQRPSE